MRNEKRKAVILFSGGLDSTTCLAYAIQQGFDCYTLTFNYGQRHEAELQAAHKIALHFKTKHHIFNLGLNAFGGSALTDHDLKVPVLQEIKADIPITYVPARNTIFLSIALGYAEVLQASDIFIGVSHVDYSNYPDCRPEYIRAFQHLSSLATKSGLEKGGVNIHTPLINLSKAETIKMGLALGLDYSLTISCYQANANGDACGICASCHLRKKGFAEAGIPDITNYAESLHG